jgi:Tfp pilus assembly protein PilO
MSSDRAILIGLALAGVLAAFWFVVLSPKREESSKLQDEIVALQQSVQAQQELVAMAEAAKESFDTNYRDLVVLGKAVPEDEDTSSLFVQLQDVAERAQVDFRAIELASGTAAPAAAPAPAETTADGAESESTSTAAGATPAVATEATAAALPIGASIGTAGLPVMPYKLSIKGDFFELADFLDGLDSLVKTRDGVPVVDGRLMTIDSFDLIGDETKGFPALTAEITVTTFVAPEEQGLTAGATPGGPAPAVAPTGGATPVATPTPTTEAP